MDSADVAAKLFRGFGEPVRLAILTELVASERRVTDLVEKIGCSQGNISGHLACLKDCGLVLDRPEGRQVFYRIASEEVIAMLQAAEELLALTGHRIELCPNYGSGARSVQRVADSAVAARR